MAIQCFQLPIAFTANTAEDANKVSESLAFMLTEFGPKGVLNLKSKYEKEFTTRTIIKRKLGSARNGLRSWSPTLLIPAADQKEAFEVKAALEYIGNELGPNGVIKLHSIYTTDKEVEKLVKKALGI